MMTPRSATVAMLAAFCALGSTATLPQAADRPDLSGVWQRDFPGMNPLIPDPPMTDWAQGTVRRRQANPRPPDHVGDGSQRR